MKWLLIVSADGDKNEHWFAGRTDLENHVDFLKSEHYDVIVFFAGAVDVVQDITDDIPNQLIWH